MTQDAKALAAKLRNAVIKGYLPLDSPHFVKVRRLAFNEIVAALESQPQSRLLIEERSNMIQRLTTTRMGLSALALKSSGYRHKKLLVERDLLWDEIHSIDETIDRLKASSPHFRSQELD